MANEARAQLLDSVHDDFRNVSERVIDCHIKNVRRKIALAALDWGPLVLDAITSGGSSSTGVGVVA